MKFKFDLLDVLIEVEATPEEVLAVAKVFTPATMVTSLVGAAKQVALNRVHNVADKVSEVVAGNVIKGPDGEHIATVPK